MVSQVLPSFEFRSLPLVELGWTELFKTLLYITLQNITKLYKTLYNTLHYTSLPTAYIISVYVLIHYAHYKLYSTDYVCGV